jgi:uncharacterized protein (TIGR03067 family)
MEISMRRHAMLFVILVAGIGVSVAAGDPSSQENQLISTHQPMTKKRVLLIGLDPAVLDFSRTPGVDAETIRAAAEASDEKLRSLGYEVRTCLIDLGATAEAVILKELSENTFDCIMIGAGLRVLPEHTLLFEKVINLIHQNAPAAKLCFNTHPSNTPDAVQRCAPIGARDAQEDAVSKELAALKGTWVVVSAVRDGNKLSYDQIEGVRFTIKETGKVLVKKGEKVLFEGTIKVDPTKTPKTEDATQTSEGENKGKTTLSIYEIEGDTLKICSAEPEKDRPAEFFSKPGSGHFLRVFKREKK